LTNHQSSLHNKKLTLIGGQDQVFSGHRNPWPSPFRFDAAVAEVFDDMAVRSIPLYHETMEVMSFWASRILRDEDRVYDLGCSTGTALALMIDEVAKKNITWVGVDDSKAMLTQAKSKLESRLAQSRRVEWIEGDLLDIVLKPSRFVVLNYVLQFLPTRSRPELLKKCFESLSGGGVLFIAEKLRPQDAFAEEMIRFRYEAFKAANGYSKAEIERKKEALENVLVGWSYEQYADELKKIGFSTVQVLLQWGAFATFVAIKDPG